MSVKATPHLDQIHVKVVCPKCGFNWWHDLGELRGHGWKIHCVCEHCIEVKPVETVYFHSQGKRKCVWGRKPQKRQVNDKQESVSVGRATKHLSVVDGLVALGYKRSEATRITDDFVTSHAFQGSDEDLFQNIVRGLKR